MTTSTNIFETRDLTRPLVAVVTGSGLVARAAVAGGADLVLALSAGSCRQAGTGSLASYWPIANANDQTLSLLREQLLPAVGDTPIAAGVLGHDPTVPLDERLATLRELGVAAITNWPAACLVDGKLRAALEAEGLGTASELALFEAARAEGFYTVAFVGSPQEAATFADAGCDGLILNAGLTTAFPEIAERRDRVDQSLALIQQMLQAVAATGHRPLSLVFGGVLTNPEDVEVLLRHAAVDGYAGGSVFDRWPVEKAVQSTVQKFKSLVRSGASDAAFGEMVGESHPMQMLYSLIERVAPVDVNVCLEGETGTGKELVARSIHEHSPRREFAFVTLNCGAIPTNLIESELFGHERGAFTGAERQRLGKFQLAHGGTLFLDEIADLSPQGQVALLRVLQQREVMPVGADRPRPVDVRIITATHQDLRAKVAAGTFRADLFYRLHEVAVTVPPLRERRHDIPALVQHISERLSVRLRRRVIGVTDDFMARLSSYSWPGNVRELEHVLIRAAVLEDGAVLGGAGVELHAIADCDDTTSRGARKAAAAAAAVARYGGNKSKAAAALGITRRTLYNWLESV